MIPHVLNTHEDGSRFLTLLLGGQLHPVVESHPNFEALLEAANSPYADTEEVLDLLDPSITIATKFESVSERVSVANGRVYFDGVEINGPFVDQILRFIEEGEEEYMPLVNFFEKVMQNPQEYSREQLQDWLATENFTITSDGDIVGYKGVAVTTDDEGNKLFTSINTGTAIVDGEVKTGAIPNAIGSEITMPRDKVQFDPGQGCSTGLHVGTYGYANGFAQGALLEVHVNPRDVVSVPTDSSAQKMRVCRYRVVDVIDAPYTAPVRDYEYTGWGDEEEEEEELHSGDVCPECGEWAYDWYCDDCATHV